MVILDEKDTTVIASGKIKVIEGKAEVLGCPINEIESKSFIPIYLNGRIEVDGEFILINGNTIPKSWINLCKEIEKKEIKKIFIIGETDTGKSTFTTWLVNSINGVKCIIDADIGQSNISHPGAMGLGIVEKTPILSNVNMVDGFFTGVISPAGREAKCLRGFNVLCKKANKIAKDTNSTTLVDTTGWVKGKRAREYKLAKIDVFSPDAVVFTSENKEMLEILKAYYSFEIFKVENFVPKKRNKEVRCKLRMRNYERWFKNFESFEISANKVVNTTLLKGKPIENLEVFSVFGDVIFAEVGSDFLNICVNNMNINYDTLRIVKKLFNVEDVNIFELNHLKNLIVGVYSIKDGGIKSERKYLCPALLKEVKFNERKFIIELSSDIFSKDNFNSNLNVKNLLFEFGEYRIDKIYEREVIVKTP